MKKGFDDMQYFIEKTNQNINNVNMYLKDDIENIRNELNQNVHNIYSDIINLSNKIDT